MSNSVADWKCVERPVSISARRRSLAHLPHVLDRPGLTFEQLSEPSSPLLSAPVGTHCALHFSRVEQAHANKLLLLTTLEQIGADKRIEYEFR